MGSWPSGRRRTPGTRVSVKAPRVRISRCPPLQNNQKSFNDISIITNIFSFLLENQINI